jgi:hypothetical protein
LGILASKIAFILIDVVFICRLVEELNVLRTMVLGNCLLCLRGKNLKLPRLSSKKATSASAVVPVSANEDNDNEDEIEMTTTRSERRQEDRDDDVAENERLLEPSQSKIFEGGDASSTEQAQLRVKFMSNPWSIIRSRLVRQLVLGVPG